MLYLNRWQVKEMPCKWGFQSCINHLLWWPENTIIYLPVLFHRDFFSPLLLQFSNTYSCMVLNLATSWSMECRAGDKRRKVRLAQTEVVLPLVFTQKVAGLMMRKTASVYMVAKPKLERGEVFVFVYMALWGREYIFNQQSEEIFPK